MKGFNLIPGRCYWLEIELSKGKRKIPVRIVQSSTTGELCMAQIDGEGGDRPLPDRILSAYEMNEFQHLKFLSSAYRRQGNTGVALDYESQAYKVMSNKFYTNRLEFLNRAYSSTARGKINNRVLEEIATLAGHRPDIDLSQIPFVLEAQLAAVREREAIEKAAELDLDNTGVITMNEQVPDTITAVMRLRAAEALLLKIRSAATLAKAGSIPIPFFIDGVLQELDDAGIK